MNGALNLCGALGRWLLGATERVGDGAVLSCRALSGLLILPWQGRQFVLQLYAIGVGSLVIIAITGAFTGMVLALQGYYSLAKFGSESLLGSVVALWIIRELGPVLAALMMTGRAGSSITAEIGIMRVTEQLDALEMMAVNPVRQVILPRMVAALLALPLLVALFDVVGLAAGYVVGVDLLGVNAGSYVGETIDKVTMHDLTTGWVKSFCFAVLLGCIATLMGYRAVPTTEGVAQATTRAVVVTSVAILIADYIITSFFL